MAQQGWTSRNMLDHYARVAQLSKAKVYNGYVPARKPPADEAKPSLNVVG